MAENGQSMTVAAPFTMSGASRAGWYVKPATVYVISSNTENPEETAKLLDYMVEDEGMVLKQGLEKGVPCNDMAVQELSDNGTLEGIQNDATQIVEEKNYPLMSPYFEVADYQTALRTAIDEVIFGKATISEAAQTAYNTMKGVN